MVDLLKFMHCGCEYNFSSGGVSPDIFGDGSDGDCTICYDECTKGNYFMEAKEYNFTNFTVCEGVKLRFCGAGVPVIRVTECFTNDGLIELRNPLLETCPSYGDPYLKKIIYSQCNNCYTTASTLYDCLQNNLTLECLSSTPAEGGYGGCTCFNQTRYPGCPGCVAGNYSCFPNAGGGGNGGKSGAAGCEATEDGIGGRGGNGADHGGRCANPGGGGGGGYGYYKGGDGGNAGAAEARESGDDSTVGKSQGGNGGNSYIGNGGNGGTPNRGGSFGCGGCSYCGNGGSGYKGGNSYYGNGGVGMCYGGIYTTTGGGIGGDSMFGDGGVGGNSSLGGCSIYGNAYCGGIGLDNCSNNGRAWGGIYGLGLFAYNLCNTGCISGRGGDAGIASDGAQMYIAYHIFSNAGSVECRGGTGTNAGNKGFLCTYAI